MKFPALMERWGLFAALVFLLLGVTLAYLEAGPVAGHGIVVRYAFWMATAAATFLAWWLSQWCIVSGRERLTRGLLLASCLLATVLFVPASLLIDALFGLYDDDGPWWASLIEEWAVSALPIFAACMIASLPAWMSMSGPFEPPAPMDAPADAPSAASAPAPAAISAATVAVGIAAPPESTLLPSAVRGGVLRATADLQYVHLHSPEGMTTVPGPMHRVIGLLGDQGLEVRRGEWIADRHVRQVKSVRGQWVVLLKDGQQVAVSRRRLVEVKERWGATRYA